jgi:NADH-quinone oxidoreductase subunit A
MLQNQIALVAYLTLFILVGVLFLFVSLLIGRFLRPHAPSVPKGEAYECGEPAVGSSYVQFDLRFYVVALLFIIFEVELAFFFPPAVVFGKVNQLRGPSFEKFIERSENNNYKLQLTLAAKEKFGELGIPSASIERMESDAAEIHMLEINSERHVEFDLNELSLMAMLDMGVFFVVLLVGFAYLWKMGDLNWVRAYAKPPAKENIGLAVLRTYGEGQ